MALRHGFVFLVYLFATLKIAQCGGRLSLKFISFENPGHRLNNGRCCDNMGLCIGNCDVFLRLCMGWRSHGLCSLLNIETATLGDDSFTFGPSLGNGHSNPIVYKFSQWTEPFRLRVTSLDDDGGSIVGRGADLISTNDFDITRAPEINADSAVTQSKTLRGYRSVLKLNYKIYCDAGYFKPSCNEYCETTDDSSGHYTCDFDNSRRICMKNWYGPSCTHFCRAQNCNVSGHYICSTNGTKICLPRWYGVVCNRYCIARDNATGHYTCNSEGDKICMTNWYGKDCTKYCDIKVTEHFKCLDSGRKVCRDDWFGTNCTRYCKPVHGPEANYTCSENGTKICGANWFATNCTRYCKPVGGPKENYLCSKNGTKICSENWYGENCNVYCIVNASTNFSCDSSGRKICYAGWYGINCSDYTGCVENTSVQSRYFCDNSTGKMVCKDGWTGDQCQMRNDSSQTSINTSLIKPSTSKQIIEVLSTTSGLNQEVVASTRTTTLSAPISTHIIPNTKKHTKTSSDLPKGQRNTIIASEDRSSVVRQLGSVTMIAAMVSTKMTSRLFKDGVQSAISGGSQGTVSSRLHILEKSLTATLVATKIHRPAQKTVSSHTISEKRSKFVSFASKIHRHNTSIPENTERKETSKLRIMAYISGPFLLCLALLFTIVGIKKLLMRRSTKVKQIKLEPELSRPLMIGSLQSTRIQSEEFNLSAIIEEPRPQDSLLGYRDV